MTYYSKKFVLQTKVAAPCTRKVGITCNSCTFIKRNLDKHIPKSTITGKYYIGYTESKPMVSLK